MPRNPPKDPLNAAMNQRIPALIGPGETTILPGLDFETYSEAGYLWNPTGGRLGLGKWEGLPNAPQAKRSISATGAAVYAEHPSTEVLSLAYDLKDGTGVKLWLPGNTPPYDLFNHIEHGGLLAAWNSAFEFFIWLHVCHGRMGWPLIDYRLLRDSMAKARRCSLPGKLEKAGKVLGDIVEQKDPAGDRLMKIFSTPRDPTKKDNRTRVLPSDKPDEFKQYNDYNIQDVVSEGSINSVIPDLSPDELELWLLDQTINFRGAHVDRESLNACLAITRQAFDRYTDELQWITGGTIESAGQVEKIVAYCAGRGVHLPNLQEATVTQALKRDDLPADIRKILKVRSMLGAASVKKLFALERGLSYDSRYRGLFMYCGADRTGRFSGQGPQPQNLTSSGPDVQRCENGDCATLYWRKLDKCPRCGAGEMFAEKEGVEWNIDAVDFALDDIKTRNLDYVIQRWGDPIDVVCGCLRGLFCAAPGNEIICSDYSAIEAVVLAVIAGEQWRIDVFNTHGLIYEKTASMITGIPFEEFAEYKKKYGAHHPKRKPMGKIPELASGFQGWVNAWIKFGADKYMTEDEMKDAILKWRAASPMIVKFWYKIEEAAILAVRYPGQCFQYRGISFGVAQFKQGYDRKVLLCRLPSGRLLWYWDPHAFVDTTPWGKEKWALTYWGWNSDSMKGPVGWIQIPTYGGKLTENITQAIARDILTHGMKNVEKAGYAIVLHVHDEIASEVKAGTGSIEEFERLMADLPAWAKGWPIKAAGGWRGHRYRKD